MEVAQIGNSGISDCMILKEFILFPFLLYIY